ncbi:nucleotide-binding protein [Candidatus Magnetomonas plexicatena]|uniref:nucleotide-binding protein n=1 Tax=Candidatus Magnetomonas plexicatena TaxID=2552947 RepID=UPI001102CF21|nr:MinD/ParA family protein [Nitrospirales bacterium LBB_01]
MDKKTICSILGPKGGVGKSNVSANLAIALAQMGKRVVAVDLDLGGANLHAILGVKEVRYTLEDLILRKVKTLEETAIDSGFKNLRVICGGTDVHNIANISFQQKVKLINHIARLDCDVVILDLAAGSSYNVVDFAFIANRNLLVTTPEVTSLMKVYTFIKSAVFRLLTVVFREAKVVELLDIVERAKDVTANPHLKSIESVLNEAEKISPKAVAFARKKLSGFIPDIVINRVQSKNDAQVGTVVSKLLKDYVGIESNVLAYIPEDEAVKKAIFTLKPVMATSPQSEFSKSILKIAASLIT